MSFSKSSTSIVKNHLRCAPSQQGGGSLENRLLLAAPNIDSATPEDVAPNRMNPQNFELYWSDEFDDDEGRWIPREHLTNTYVRYEQSEPRLVRKRWEPSQTAIANGVLTTRAGEVTTADGETVLSGGWLRSADNFNPTDSPRGRIYMEARVKIPVAHGFHTAWWLLPENGFGDDPTTGADGAEVDIYEGNDQRGHTNRVFAGQHINGYAEHHQSNNSNVDTGVANVRTDWNVVGLSWDKNLLELWWNGKMVKQWSGKWVPHVDEYMIFSTQFAGQNFDGSLPEDLSTLNSLSVQEVDWVRVYRKIK